VDQLIKKGQILSTLGRCDLSLSGKGLDKHGENKVNENSDNYRLANKIHVILCKYYLSAALTLTRAGLS